jgi:lipoprotein-releasing system permease protein
VYHALLTRRYLTSKVMPLLAALAVTLCTAMVLITWSVMGGFLTMLVNSGRGMIGDVSVVWPSAGFAHYEEFIRRLEAEKSHVAAATPMIETFGLVQLPDGRTEGVAIKGIDAATFRKVTEFDRALYWQPREEALPRDHERKDPRLDPKYRELLERTLRDGLAMREPDGVTGVERPAAVPGVEMSGFNLRDPAQFYTTRMRGMAQPDGSVQWVRQFLPDSTVTVIVVPLTKGGRMLEQVARVFPVANEFRSGVYEVDRKTIYVELSALQQMLKMDEALRIAGGAGDGGGAAKAGGGAGAGGGGGGGVVKLGDRESFGEIRTEGVEPARVTSVLVRAAEGVSADELQAKVTAVYRAFEQDHKGQVPNAEDLVASNLISTWEQANATLIGAVKKETVLVLSLLGFISLTASFLILAIFWAMVAEKTKDIGVLRAVGASRMGVAWLWLRYGLAIGVIGSLMGGSLAYVIVTNINPIHEWLGAQFGVQVWDPKVYYFSEIPNRVEPMRAALVLAAGVGFSVLGAVIPAVRAARMDPVRALRFE